MVEVAVAAVAVVVEEVFLAVELVRVVPVVALLAAVDAAAEEAPEEAAAELAAVEAALEAPVAENEPSPPV